MTGTAAATGAIWLVQHDCVLHELKLYECQEAARLWSGSVGSWASHWVRSLEYSMQPSMITLIAPAGIGFWQGAGVDGQPEEVPVYTPSVQCRSRMATMPLSLSRLT